jgi:hypothetical protein
MKLRIKGNTLRLRVSRSKVPRLLSGDRLEETIHFTPEPVAKFTYALQPGLGLKPATGLQRPPVLVGQLFTLENAGASLPDKLDVQHAPAPRLVAVGALAVVPVVTPKKR